MILRRWRAGCGRDQSKPTHPRGVLYLRESSQVGRVLIGVGVSGGHPGLVLCCKGRVLVRVLRTSFVGRADPFDGPTNRVSSEKQKTSRSWRRNDSGILYFHHHGSRTPFWRHDCGYGVCAVSRNAKVVKPYLFENDIGDALIRWHDLNLVHALSNENQPECLKVSAGKCDLAQGVFGWLNALFLQNVLDGRPSFLSPKERTGTSRCCKHALLCV